MADAAPAAKPDEAMDGDVRSNGPSEVQLLRCVSMHLAYIPVLSNALLVLSMLIEASCSLYLHSCRN